MNKKAACTIVQTALAPTRGFEPPKCRSALRARIALTALADAGIGNRADLTGGRRFARNKKAACTIVQTALASTRGFEPPKCRSALRARIALTALADAGIGNRADLTGGRRFARNKKSSLHHSADCPGTHKRIRTSDPSLRRTVTSPFRNTLCPQPFLF